MNALPSYGKKILADVQSMTPQINAAAARYGVPAEAIAGSLAQELLDRTASYENQARQLVHLSMHIDFSPTHLRRA